MRDLEVSWERRRQWYLELLQQGGALWIAHDPERHLIGYAYATLTVGPDDTFDSSGTAELVSLFVDKSHRGSGVGAALVRAVEGQARGLGIDIFKVAVMEGNDMALTFYRSNGFELAEHVLYRRIQ